MAKDKTIYEYRNPLTTRYASQSMAGLFSEQMRAEVWRELWIYLAEAEMSLGLPIRSSQIDQMKKFQKAVDLKRIREIELKLKHDVMSHVKAFGEQAPLAEPIIHLGATSAFVTDNGDVLILKRALELVREKLVEVLSSLRVQILKWKSVAAVGYTHFQPAQPVTIGKRLSLWAQDLLWDLEELDHVLDRLRPLGCKGATGTQASFLVLFDGDQKRVDELDLTVSQKMGFEESVAVSGQTLSRKVDTWFMNALSGIASSFSKMSYDLRLLQHTGEWAEPFGKSQIGSSAMAYKRNPMLAERITSLSRFLISLSQNAAWTHATQWLERSLDDSANRRIVLAEGFLTADALCEMAYRIVSGLELNKKGIQERLDQSAGLFETEAQMMRATLKGGSRQKEHEKIRKKTVLGKSSGSGKVRSSLPTFTGAAALQAERFVKNHLDPALKSRKSRRKSEALFSAVSV